MQLFLFGTFVTQAQEEIKVGASEKVERERHVEGNSDVFKLLRDPRDPWALLLVWNSLGVSVNERYDGCPLKVVATLEETDVAAVKKIPATRINENSLLELPPTGGPVELNITCQSGEEDAAGDYKLVITNELRPLYATFAVVGLFLIIIAPILSSSVAFVYLGGTTLTFFLISLVIIYKLSKSIGAKRTTPLAMMVFAVLPTDYRSNAFHYYLTTVLWPLQTIGNHLLGNSGLADDDQKKIMVAVACLLVWLCLLIGFLVVRNFAINRATGEVDAGAAEFLCWTIRLVGIVLLLNSSMDPQFPVAVVMLVALFIPPGSYIVSGSFKTVYYLLKMVHNLLRIIFFPVQQLWRLLRWIFGARRTRLEEDFHPNTPKFSETPRQPNSGSYVHQQPGLFESRDPEPFSPAAGPVPLRLTKGVAAHTRGRWMSPLEMAQQSRDTTQQQLGALLHEPEYRAWIIANQHRISVRRESSNFDDEEEHLSED